MRLKKGREAIIKKIENLIRGGISITWAIVFIYSWAVFIIFADRSRLGSTACGGFIALALGSVVDWAGHRLNLYQFNDSGIPWHLISFFYVAGPLFTMGTLFFQYISRNRLLQAANIIIFSLAYLSVELLLVMSGGATYISWHFLASLLVDLIVFTAFSYVGEIIVYGKTGIKTGL
ncbi:MAG: hypothetical protein ACOY4I_16545 [Bacillota bacterium]